MNKTVKEQVKSGLRVGGGIGALMIAVLPLCDGFRRLWITSVPYHFSFFGLGEVLIAAAILLATAHLWLPYFGGCMLLGALQGVLLVLTGHGVYTHTALPRLTSAAFVVFCAATVALLSSKGRREGMPTSGDADPSRATSRPRSPAGRTPI